MNVDRNDDGISKVRPYLTYMRREIIVKQTGYFSYLLPSSFPPKIRQPADGRNERIPV